MDNSQSRQDTGQAFRRDREDRPKHQPSLLTTFQDIIDAYSQSTREISEPDTAESDVEDEDEYETDIEEPAIPDVRTTAEEIADLASVGMVRFTIRSVRSISV